MLVSSGVLAALFLLGPQVTDPTARTILNPPTTTLSEVAVEGEAEEVREDIALRRNPDEVICETRAVTGSRFNQRRCRTRQ